MIKSRRIVTDFSPGAQLDKEDASLSGNGFYPDGTAMFPDNPPAYRQPQPHAAFFCRVKRLENVLEVLRTDSASRILDGNTDGLTFAGFNFYCFVSKAAAPGMASIALREILIRT